MKSLEDIAKKMFSDFAKRKSGYYLDWKYVSPERKLEWMKEVADTYLECLKNLKQDLSIGKLPSPGAPSYERGMVAGMANEAHRLNERISAMEIQVTDQLADFIEREASKDVD